MDKTRKIIIKHSKKFPDFNYYISILDTIENQISSMPDVSIEACKALIEGISKTILNLLNIPYKDHGRDADSPSSLLRKVLNTLTKNTDFDIVYAQLSLSMVTRIAEIRNERGDLSHGRSAPKLVSSSSDLAELIADVSDGVVYYLLKIVFSTDWSDLSEIKYEDQPTFNEMLDQSNPIQGIVYSRALYDQDIISYKEQLKNYNAERDEEQI